MINGEVDLEDSIPVQCRILELFVFACVGECD